MKQDAIKLLRTVFPFVVSCAICYLIGSFISVSFDPAGWTMDCRILMSLFGFSFGFAMLMKIEHGSH